ncbi:MAG: YggS family pyridoxal phosphate-dependent enzyme [bacterium]
MRSVVLASASPRRQDMLARITWPYAIAPADIDETQLADEDAEAYVRRLACAKACVISRERPQAAVLGSDTIVVLDGKLLGKPANEEEALAMVGSLCGRTHQVLTGVAWALGGEVREAQVVSSCVSLRDTSDAELRDYIATGECMDKAGGYAIQGEAGSFVSGVTGSVTNVIGLPLAETEALARAVGVEAPVGPLPTQAVERRFAAVAGEVQALAVASGRPPDSARLLTVVKGLPVELAEAAVRAGARDLGENYVQEATRKRERIGAGVNWHLIGPLQSNKAKLAADVFDCVQTIGKASTARALAKRATAPMRILLQVNVGRDAAKSGVAPEALQALAEELRGEPNLRVEGLMTIGRAKVARAETRSAFAELRERLEDLRARELVAGGELSMGMSDDYDLAIAEGATLVRLGTAVLGPRPPVT